MGSAYTVRHAAVLAEQLPASSRIKSDGLKGLTFDEALLVLVEYNTRLAWWARTEEAQRSDAQPPRPLVDFSEHGEERGNEPMDLESLKAFLTMDREELVEDGE